MALPPRVRVLIITADRELRDDIASLALQHGYDVLAAANAIDTIDLLETSARPDLAIVDPRSPGVLGRSVMAYVRDDVRLRSIPVTVLVEPYRAEQVLPCLGVVRSGPLVA